MMAAAEQAVLLVGIENQLGAQRQRPAAQHARQLQQRGGAAGVVVGSRVRPASVVVGADHEPLRRLWTEGDDQVLVESAGGFVLLRCRQRSQLLQLAPDPLRSARLSRCIVAGSKRHQRAHQAREPLRIGPGTLERRARAGKRLDQEYRRRADQDCEDGCEQQQPFQRCFPSTSSIALPNAGRSLGTRAETRLRSITAG